MTKSLRCVFAVLLLSSAWMGCDDDEPKGPDGGTPSPDAGYEWDGTSVPLEEHGDLVDTGRFAPCSSEEKSVTRPQVGAEEESVAPEAGVRQEPKKERTPPIDWAGLLRRTFAVDVFACVRCGGRRRVLAYVKQAGGVRAIVEHLGLPTAGASLTPARAPPQGAWC